jgi:hypothetical protein
MNLIVRDRRDSSREWRAQNDGVDGLRMNDEECVGASNA